MRALTDSIALVEHTTRRISVSKARNGTNSDQEFSQSFTIAGYLPPHASVNSQNRSSAADSVDAVYTGLRALAIASQCWRAAYRNEARSRCKGEITDHLGYDHGDPAGRGTGNSRNGTRTKTVVTDVGPVDIDVPRDRAGSFEPQVVRKRQRRLNGVENMVLSLSAKGLTHGEISAHLREVYGAEVSKQTISTITDKVIDGMAEWQNRPLDSVYPVLFLDAIHVKIRDGKVANRPIYVALAVTVDGTRDILGLWAGDGGEGAKFWLQILTELRNRGAEDVCMLVCDGLKGLPDAIGQVWPAAVVQTCVVARFWFRWVWW